MSLNNKHLVENVIYKVIINSANQLKNVSDQKVAHSIIHGITTKVTSKLIRKMDHKYKNTPGNLKRTV